MENNTEFRNLASGAMAEVVPYGRGWKTVRIWTLDELMVEPEENACPVCDALGCWTPSAGCRQYESPYDPRAEEEDRRERELEAISPDPREFLTEAEWREWDR